VPIERSLDLNTHIIGLGVDSGMAVSAAAHPARPHDDHQHVAVLNACPNVFAKIQSWRDAVDVAKDSLATITAGEPVEDAAGDVHRIVTTIGNRDLGHVNNALRRQHRRKGGCGKASRAEDSLWGSPCLRCRC
jgi:hypothetical protein